jgi:hypothetical protein
MHAHIPTAGIFYRLANLTSTPKGRPIAIGAFFGLASVFLLTSGSFRIGIVMTNYLRCDLSNQYLTSHHVPRHSTKHENGL